MPLARTKNQEGSHRQFVHPSKPGKGYNKWPRIPRDQTETFENHPNSGYSAYAPDLPGCIATGLTLHDTREQMRGAIEFHLRGLREDGDPIPEPSHAAAIELLEVA